MTKMPAEAWVLAAIRWWLMLAAVLAAVLIGEPLVERFLERSGP